VHEDLDDTVMAPPRRNPLPDGGIDEDTIVPSGQNVDSAPAPAPTAAASGSTTKQPVPNSGLPVLIEPVSSHQRRVPLTHQRLQETLRTQGSAREVLILPRPESATVPQTYGFRLGDRAPIALDVPAFVGRKPVAPRVPGKVFPRLVRVPSPLNEVSGTHVELRQEGACVIVTDLRSTNGTIVRMPGSRPVKLRQGNSLVVRAGTLVDIGDGNILEILPPPRLSAIGNAATEGTWT
jgi:hypothetical protein